MKSKLATLHELSAELKRLTRQCKKLEEQIASARIAAATEVAGFRVGEHVISTGATSAIKHWSGYPLHEAEAVVESICFESEEEAARVAAAHSRGKPVEAHLYIQMRFVTNAMAWFGHGITPKQLKQAFSRVPQLSGR